MKSELQALISGRTRIIESKDEQGHPILEVRISELTPFRAKVVDNLAGLTALGAVAATFYGLLQTAHPSIEEMILTGVITMSSFLLAKGLWRGLLLPETVVILTVEDIHFHSKEQGYTKLSRLEHHGFELCEHKECSTERQEHEFSIRQDQMRGRPVNRKKYYQESQIVALNYGGISLDLIEIFGIKEGKDVRAALMLADDTLDNYLQNQGEDPEGL